MELLVKRSPNSIGTPGQLYIDGVLFCNTLEPYSPKEGETRIKGKCCAPLGKYQIKPRFEGEVYDWMKESVPAVADGGIPHIMNLDGITYPYWINGRGIQEAQDVLIHIGNVLSDTLGCLLIGVKNTQNTIAQSTITFNKFYPLILPAMTAGDLTIEYV
jgi:hypothetical protein